MRQTAKKSYSDGPETMRKPALCDGHEPGLSRDKPSENIDDMVRKMIAKPPGACDLQNPSGPIPQAPDAAMYKKRAARHARRQRRQAWGNVLDETEATHFDTAEDEAARLRREVLARSSRRKPAQRAKTPRKAMRGRRWLGVWVAMALVAVVQPQLISDSLILGFMVLVAGGLLLGPGLVVDFIYGLWAIVMQSNPTLADNLRNAARKAEVGIAWGRHKLLGKFPKRWGFRDSGPPKTSGLRGRRSGL